MQKHRKLKARILSLALSVAMVTSMMPGTVFAVEGDNIQLGASSVGEIKSFDKLESRFIPNIGEGASSHIYSLPVELDTAEADLNLPTELTGMVERIMVSTPNGAEVDEDTNDTVSGNQAPASPSDAEETVDEAPSLSPEPEQDTYSKEERENIPVTWNSNKTFTSERKGGLFIYTAQLPKDYKLADGIKAPQIYVFVGNRQARTSGTHYDINLATVADRTTADNTSNDKGYVLSDGILELVGDANATYKLIGTANANVKHVASFSPTEITLDGVTLLQSTENQTLNLLADTTIKLKGTNSIANSKSADGACAIAGTGTLTIEKVDDTGTLTATASGTVGSQESVAAIYTSGTFTVASGTVNANGKYGIVSDSAVTINGGKVTASGNLTALLGTVTIGTGSPSIKTGVNNDGTGATNVAANTLPGRYKYVEVDFVAAAAEVVAFSGLAANGTSGTTTTTELTLSFDKEVSGLTVDDITLTGATKGTLTQQTDKKVYKLAVSGITVVNGANVTVAVAKTGFTFTPTSKTVAVNVATNTYDFEIDLAGTFSAIGSGYTYDSATKKLTITGTAEQTYKLTGDGGSNVASVIFNSATDITLDNVVLSGATKEIFRVPDGATIKLKGTNSITNTGYVYMRQAVTVGGSLTIENADDSAPGALIITVTTFGNDGYGIYTQNGNITINSGTVTINASTVNGPYLGINSREIIINGGNVTVAGTFRALAGTLSVTGTPLIKASAYESGSNATDKTDSEVNSGGFKYVKVTFLDPYTGNEAVAPSSTPSAKTATSITLTAVEVSGETVEYAKSTTSTAPTSDADWQTSTEFTGLTGDTTYYFFARVKASDTHKAGAASAGTSIKTDVAGVYNYEINLAGIFSSMDSGNGYTYSDKYKTLVLSGSDNETYRLYGNGGSNITNVIVTNAAQVTLDNATINATNNNTGIRFDNGGGEIKLVGTNHVKATGDYGIAAENNAAVITIGGTGSLAVEATSAGIYPGGGLIVNSGTVISKGSYGIMTGQLGTVTINAGNITTEGSSYGIMSPSITFQGTTTVVKAKGGSSALRSAPTCNDGIAASGGTWESANTEVIWQVPAWTSYTVTFNANGGTVSTASATTGKDGKLASLPTPTRADYSFNGWFTAASGGTQVSTSTVYAQDTTVYAQWTYTGGGSSSGGGSSNATTSAPTTSAPTTDTPTTDAPKTGSTTVTAPVDNQGNATVNVTDEAVADAIKAAQDAAKKDNLIGKMISVEIVVNTDKAATQVTATLPKTVQDTLISNKVDAVKITTSTVTMTFSQTAIQQINTQAKADVTITAAKSDTSKLTGDAKALIGSRPMFDFNATYGNGKSITDFGGNTVSIAIPYTLGAGEVPGNLYGIYVDGNGNAAKITNSSYDTNQKAVIFTTSHFSQYGIGYQAMADFTDIANHWAKMDIEFVFNRGLMSGTSNTTFSPNGSITRAMFVTALGRLAGVDVNSYKTATFTDVKADSYYAPYVNWAAEKGITSGTTAATFSPDNTVTRQEMAVFMSNYAKAMDYKVPETRAAVTFADNASIGSFATAAVKQMQMAGVLNGKNGNQFDPTGTATRAEVAAVLHRYVELLIDRSTAQGLDTNDSGSAIMYENGNMVKSASRTVGSKTYNFNANGEAALRPADNQKTGTYTVQKGDSFWLIAKKNNCTMAELELLNGKSRNDTIYAGQVLKVPQK